MKPIDESSRFHPVPIKILKAVAAILVASMLSLWGWNETAAGLTDLPVLQFKHAVAALSLLAATAYVTGLGLRLGLKN